MRKKGIPVISLLLFLLITVDLVTKEKFVIEKFEKFIKNSLKEWKIPGIAIGVMNNGYIILAKGYGYRDRAKELPVTRYTLFPIGSSSKAFTSFVIGKLVDEKLLSWDDPVKKHLADFELYDPWVTEHFTVSDLLIHNSGLPRHDMTWYGSDRSREELFKGLKYLKNNKGFRTTFQYQNLMFMTAGYLAGKVKGSTWEALVKEYIFNPLEMEGANFSIEESEISENYSLPYVERGNKIVEIPFYRKLNGIGPAGSINSNIYDLLKWVKLQLDGGKWEKKVLISKKNIEMIHTPKFVAGGTIVQVLGDFDEISYPAYGMGWFVNHYRGHNLIHHGGNIDGFSALITFMPDLESAVVVLTNKGGNLLTYTAAFRVYDKLMGKKPIDWESRFMKILEERKKAADSLKEKNIKEKKGDVVQSDPIDLFSGVYNDPAYGKINISVSDGILFFKFNSTESPLKHYDRNIFIIEEGILSGSRIEFIKSDSGNADRISIRLEKNSENIIFKK